MKTICPPLSKSMHRLIAVHRRKVSGFTLVELLVTILVAGILASMAAPSFTGIIASQRTKSVASDLHNTLVGARSEATKRNLSITVAPVGGSAWENGWQIYPSATPTNILGNYSAAKTVTITSTSSPVIYQNSGRVQNAVMFVITATSGSSSAQRCVSVDLSGRPYVKAGASC